MTKRKRKLKALSVNPTFVGIGFTQRRIPNGKTIDWIKIVPLK